MIIDCHTHIHPHADGLGDRYDASAKTLVEALRQSPIDRAVVLPIAPRVSNEFVFEVCRAYPDELIGFASVEPQKGDQAIEEFEQAVTKLGLQGLKLHPRMQGFGQDDLEQVVPLIQKCANLKVPALIDAFPYGQDVFKTRSIELINNLAQAVPQARIILAHAGGYQLFDALVVAKANRNVFLDISFTPQYYRGTSIINDLGFVIHKLGAERIIYGSDHPEMPALSTFYDTVKILEEYGLNSSQMDAILGKNMDSLIS